MRWYREREKEGRIWRREVTEGRSDGVEVEGRTRKKRTIEMQ